MLEFTTGSIFHTGAQALVNPTNCVGPMGAGLAKQFDRRYPANTAAYRSLCRLGRVQPGTLVWYATQAARPSWIINLPTKDHYRDPSRLEYVKKGLVALKRELAEREIETVAIPALGAGLGGLAWHDVKELMAAQLRDVAGCHITVLKPGNYR